VLQTPTAVIRRTGVEQLHEYEDLGPRQDCPGFFCYRPYPHDSPLARVTTQDGRPAIRCLIQFIVDPPKPSSSVSRVHLHARLSRRWNPGRIWTTEDPDAYNSSDPDSPSPQSATLLKKVRRPLDLDFVDDYIYDNREDIFIDDGGNVVGPEQMLERAYTKHCRSYRWRFLIRWKIESALRWIIQKGVWRGQDVAMWLLLNFYDVELKDKDLRNPLHRYLPSEFRRITEEAGERSHFFGFQSSRKSFFTNLVALVAVCVLIYWKAPHTGLIRAIYNNTALTTAALVFGFLVADVTGPWLLIRIICLLSRLRESAMFFIRKVHV